MHQISKLILIELLWVVDRGQEPGEMNLVLTDNASIILLHIADIQASLAVIDETVLPLYTEILVILHVIAYTTEIMGG